MARNTKGLKTYAEEKTKLALEKVEKAIREFFLNGENINFNSVMVDSGVSKSFLYNNKEIKERIEDLRQKQISR
jgi:predicted DsbA family dithiol-disulfide isomerase